MLMKMEQKILLGLIMCVGLMAKEAIATQHIVGGSQGWYESTDFDSWSSAQKFQVGDQLVFKYSSGLHSVVELSDEDAYKKCDIGSGAVDSMSTGNDVVKLNKAGTRYFGCGTLGHCQQGMKLKITTGTATASSSSSSSSSSKSPAAASSSSSSCSLFQSHNNYFVLIISALLLAMCSFVYML